MRVVPPVAVLAMDTEPAGSCTAPFTVTPPLDTANPPAATVRPVSGIRTLPPKFVYPVEDTCGFEVGKQRSNTSQGKADGVTTFRSEAAVRTCINRFVPS